MMTDPIADMLTRIRNAALARHDRVRDAPLAPQGARRARSSSPKASSTTSARATAKAQKTLTVVLTYGRDRQSAIDGISRVSAPGPSRLRPPRPHPARPLRHGHLDPLARRRGVMTDKQARASSASAASSSARCGDGHDRSARTRRSTSSTSRVGKRPVELPKGVTVTRRGRQDRRQGPEGHALARAPAEREGRRIEGSKLTVVPTVGGRDGARLQGLARALIAGMVKGAADGYDEDARARRHRLPRRGEGQDLHLVARLLAPGELPDAGRHQGARSPATRRARSSS